MRNGGNKDLYLCMQNHNGKNPLTFETKYFKSNFPTRAGGFSLCGCLKEKLQKQHFSEQNILAQLSQL